MNDRIKKVRRHLGFSQKEFAEKLGLTQSGVSWMEQQGKTVSDQNIRLICTLFSVNENWLRTGEEPMIAQSDTSLIDDLAIEYNMSEKQKKIIATFVAMDERKREILSEAFFEFIDVLVSSPDISATIAVRPAANDDILDRTAAHKLLDEEFDTIEKTKMSLDFTGINGLVEKNKNSAC